MNAPNGATKGCFDTLLNALGAANYEQFISVGDEQFRKGIGPSMFLHVSQSIRPRMNKGFMPTFLGELRQGSSLISLWQLRFDDGGDDLLFRMGMAGGKATGALVTPAFSK